MQWSQQATNTRETETGSPISQCHEYANARNGFTVYGTHLLHVPEKHQKHENRTSQVSGFRAFLAMIRSYAFVRNRHHEDTEKVTLVSSW